MRRLIVAVNLPILLACSGIVDSALEQAAQDPNFRESFEKSFRESFIQSCADRMVDDGAERPMATQVCGCMSDQLANGRDAKELFRLMSNLEAPEAQAALDAARSACGIGD